MSGPFDRQLDPRRTALEGRQVLERTADSIARSHQTAIDTEHIGTTVISELGEQRESLLRSKRRLQETNEGLSRSRSLVRSMAIKAFTNKLILIVIILLEIAILCGLVYLKFFSKH